MSNYSKALEFFIENGISLNDEQVSALQEALFSKPTETKELIKSVASTIKSFLKTYKVTIGLSPVDKKEIRNNIIVYQIGETGYSKFAKGWNEYNSSTGNLSARAVSAANNDMDAQTDKQIQKTVDILQDKDAIADLNSRLSRLSHTYKLSFSSVSSNFIKISAVKNHR